MRKEFKSYSSRSGLKGAFRDLLTRNYKIVPAVNDISFTVKQGEMVGYIGENGAGKSTTIKMLTGILTPTSGEIVVNGMNPHREREKFTRTIGVSIWTAVAALVGYCCSRIVSTIKKSI